MSIYSYDQLKGKLRVGMRVRAVPGGYNLCNELNDNGSNIRRITQTNDVNFSINNCWHEHIYKEGYFLEIIDDEKTFHNLMEGDVILDGDGDERTILAVVNPDTFSDTRVYALSSKKLPKLIIYLYTAYELKEDGYTIKNTPTPSSDITELSLDDIAKKFDLPVEKIRIKKEEE